MRALLIQPPYTFKEDIPLVVQMPLGLACIAAVARERGHEVQILDCLAEGYNQPRRRAGWTRYGLVPAEIKRRIRAARPQVVGVSNLFTMQSHNAELICRLAKECDPDIVTVLGGTHPTIRPAAALASSRVDFVLRGEADHSFTHLLDALQSGGDLAAVDGLCHRDRHGELRINEKTSFIDDLDALPFPARDLLPLELYWRARLVHGFNLRGRRNFNVVTSRGCPASCAYCNIRPLWGKRFRARSPQNVVAELQHLKATHGADHVQFEDDNLTCDLDRAKELFRLMAPLGLPWNTPNGVSLWRMDRQCLELMRAAGCYYVRFGIESGSQQVLTELMHKPLDLKEALPLIPHARSLGMKVCGFFVVGTPGETRAQIQRSFDLPHEVDMDWVEYSIATPHWGTRLREQARQGGHLRPHRLQDLYSRRGNIDTEEFSAAWLERKIDAEHRRYLRHLALHRPRTFLTQGWEVFRRNPGFVLRYLRRLYS